MAPSQNQNVCTLFPCITVSAANDTASGVNRIELVARMVVKMAVKPPDGRLEVDDCY
jgi:hypothetical protein